MHPVGIEKDAVAVEFLYRCPAAGSYGRLRPSFGHQYSSAVENQFERYR